MSLEIKTQKIQNSLFELDCPLAVHVIEEELPEPELKYQILEWLFEKYKTINNETLDISESIAKSTSTTKKTVSSRLSSPSSSYSSLDIRKKREASPLSKKKESPLDQKITNLVTNCAILGCCNIKDAAYFKEKGLKLAVLNIYENIIEMINISNYFDYLTNEEIKIENPLKYPRLGVKNINDEVTKDIEFLNDICGSKNLSVLSNKSCGNILSKDLAALVNVENNENKKVNNTTNQIDLTLLNEEIEKWNQEINQLEQEYNSLKSQYKYADQDEEDNTQVLHSLYTLSQHLATYIEGFNLRFPLEIESWIYSNPNTNNQIYSPELGNVIARLTVLMKEYHQIINNIANIKKGYEQLVYKPSLDLSKNSKLNINNNNDNNNNSNKNLLKSDDNIMSPMGSMSPLTPLSPFANSYSLYQNQEEIQYQPQNSNEKALGGRINIDSEIKEIQRMEHELQRSINILTKSQERKKRNIKYNIDNNN